MSSFWNDFINGVNDGLIHIKREQIRQEQENLICLAQQKANQIIYSNLSDFEKERYLRILQNELNIRLNNLNDENNKTNFIDALNKISKHLK